MGTDAFSLTDRVALVTGGNGGLGRAIAIGLRAAGASVAVTGRDREKNAAAATELGDPGAVFSLDVRDEAAVERTVTGVVARFGRLDILVTCAGDFAGRSALDLPLADWERVLASHLTGTFLCARHTARAMARAEGGKILTYLALKARGLSHTRASVTIACKLARRCFHTLHELGPEALEPVT
jgi:2-dehydro-3-deoxy-D-gluconate 5-dehydrogenase